MRHFASSFGSLRHVQSKMVVILTAYVVSDAK
jgi:hypothetical protein